MILQPLKITVVGLDHILHDWLEWAQFRINSLKVAVLVDRRQRYAALMDEAYQIHALALKLSEKWLYFRQSSLNDFWLCFNAVLLQ